MSISDVDVHLPISQRILLPQVTSEEGQQRLYEKSGFLKYWNGLANIGSLNCHFVGKEEATMMSDPAPLTLLGSHIILQRLSDTHAVISKREYIPINYLKQDIAGYKDHFASLARAVRDYQIGCMASVAGKPFDAARGLATEALFFVLAKNMGLPIRVSTVGEDHNLHTDFVIGEGDNKVDIDITSTSLDPRRLFEKFDQKRPRLVLVVPTIPGMVTGEIVEGLGKAMMALMDNSHVNITSEMVRRGDIQAIKFAAPFISAKDSNIFSPPKVLFSSILALNKSLFEEIAKTNPQYGFQTAQMLKDIDLLGHYQGYPKQRIVNPYKSSRQI